MSETITTTLTRDEFVLVWNCVWSEIANREHELTFNSCDGVRQLLTELYAVEKKLKALCDDEIVTNIEPATP